MPLASKDGYNTLFPVSIVYIYIYIYVIFQLSSIFPDLTVALLHVSITEKESEKIKDAVLDMIDAEIMEIEAGSPHIYPPKEKKEVGSVSSFLNSCA